MKNIIKAALLLLFISFSIQSFPQFRVGVKAGLNLTNVRQNFTDSGSEWDTKPRALFSVGPCADIGFGRFLSLQPGLLLSAKGFSADVVKVWEASSGYDRYTIYYLEVPIHLAVKLKMFQVYTGPYLAVGLTGKNKWDMDFNGDKDSGIESIPLGSSWNSSTSDAYVAATRFDYGWDLGVGCKLGPILINTGLELGLANITPDDTSDSSYDRSEWKISNIAGVFSVTYFFGRWR